MIDVGSEHSRRLRGLISEADRVAAWERVAFGSDQAVREALARLAGLLDEAATLARQCLAEATGPEAAQQRTTYSVDCQEHDGSWQFWGTYRTLALAIKARDRLLGPLRKPAVRLSPSPSEKEHTHEAS